jgi:hypothetical protein
LGRQAIGLFGSAVEAAIFAVAGDYLGTYRPAPVAPLSGRTIKKQNEPETLF